MTFSRLAVQPMMSADDAEDPASTLERVSLSADFVIDGSSLLETLFELFDARYDLCGCLMGGYPELTEESLGELLCRAKAPLESGRVAIYVSVCCAEIGCGGFAARVHRTSEGFTWSDFAFEHASWGVRECPRPIAFHFRDLEYREVLQRGVEIVRDGRAHG